MQRLIVTTFLVAIWLPIPSYAAGPSSGGSGTRTSFSCPPESRVCTCDGALDCFNLGKSGDCLGKLECDPGSTQCQCNSKFAVSGAPNLTPGRAGTATKPGLAPDQAPRMKSNKKSGVERSRARSK